MRGDGGTTAAERKIMKRDGEVGGGDCGSERWHKEGGEESDVKTRW